MPPNMAKRRLIRGQTAVSMPSTLLLPNTSLQRSLGGANPLFTPWTSIPWGSSGQVGNCGLRKFFGDAPIWGSSQMGFKYQLVRIEYFRKKCVLL
ncbi:hypothetical protein CEXT_340181 [Caerostris extrusa]|uniref:Uncharacterized protein n=1 Tax=Caerostris extrusa TaxID=172846 RepID=A0AAV4TWP8_CAEEX|nr:hypothetical protein CEXT_340181 [Caerostris extrusa]